MSKKPTPVVQKQDKNVVRGEAPARRNEEVYGMITRGWGAGAHRSRGREEQRGAPPKHKKDYRREEYMTSPTARFEEGKPADPTKNMSPEDAAKWDAMNEAHRDQFKAAARYSKDPYWMIAKYPGKDADGKPFRKGERVFYYPLTKTILTGAKADRASAEFDAASFDEDYGFRAASGPADEKDYKTALRRLAVAKKALQRVPVTEAANLNKRMREFDNRMYDRLRVSEGSTYIPADFELIAEVEKYRTEVLQALASLKDITLGKGAVRADLWDSVRKLPTINRNMRYMGEVLAFANILARAAVIVQLKAEQAERSVDYLTKWVEFYNTNDRAPTYGEQRGWVRLASNSLAAAWGPVLSRVADLADETCWEGYEAYGFKEKDGQSVPNCLPVKKADDTSAQDRSPVMQRQAAHPLDRVRGHQLWPASVSRKVPPLYSQEKEKDPIAWVKLFSPHTDAVWYITEYDPSSGEAFGWADLGMGGGELGYISIRELEGLNRKGLPLVERDLSWKERPLSRAKSSRMASEDRTAKFPKGVEMTVDEVAKVVGPEFKEMNENPPDSVVSLREEMAGGKEASVSPLASAWGNLMVIVANEGSPEVDKAALKEDADPASHDQNLASTWEKVAGGSGAANAAFLRRSPLKDKILRAVAKHYGTSVSEIEDELTDPDAEALYEYIGNDPALRMQVYREFKW